MKYYLQLPNEIKDIFNELTRTTKKDINYYYKNHNPNIFEIIELIKELHHY